MKRILCLSNIWEYLSLRNAVLLVELHFFLNLLHKVENLLFIVRSGGQLYRYWQPCSRLQGLPDVLSVHIIELVLEVELVCPA